MQHEHQLAMPHNSREVSLISVDGLGWLFMHAWSNCVSRAPINATPTTSKQSGEVNGTWRHKHVNHKEHVAKLRHRLESEAAKQTPPQPIPHVVKKIYTPQQSWAPGREKDPSVVRA